MIGVLEITPRYWIINTKEQLIELIEIYNSKTSRNILDNGFIIIDYVLLLNDPALGKVFYRIALYARKIDLSIMIICNKVKLVDYAFRALTDVKFKLTAVQVI